MTKGDGDGGFILVGGLEKGNWFRELQPQMSTTVGPEPVEWNKPPLLWPEGLLILCHCFQNVTFEERTESDHLELPAWCKEAIILMQLVRDEEYQRTQNLCNKGKGSR